MKKVIISALIGALFGGAVVFTAKQPNFFQQNQMVANAKGLPETPEITKNEQNITSLDTSQQSFHIKKPFGLTNDNSDNVNFYSSYSVPTAYCGNATVSMDNLEIMNFKENTFFNSNTKIKVTCQNKKSFYFGYQSEYTKKENAEYLPNEIFTNDFSKLKCEKINNSYKLILTSQCGGAEPPFCVSDYHWDKTIFAIDTETCEDETISEDNN